METNKFDLRKMPKGWEVIDFQETVTKISTNRKKIKQKEYLERGAIPVIDQGQELIGGFTDDKKSVINCDLPVLVFGDHTKVIKLVTFPFAPGADGIKVIKPLSIFLPKLFASFVRVIVHKIPDKGYARHFQHLEKTNIPLPPLAEQHRIVDKIEELFSDLDAGNAALKKAQQQLKVYRQAVLKWAFEGKLTAQWREEQKRQGKLESAETLLEQIKAERERRYQAALAQWQADVKAWEANGKVEKKPGKPKDAKLLPAITDSQISQLPELPNPWIYIYLAYTGDLGRGKSKHRPRNDPKLFGGSYPFIQTGEIKAAKGVLKHFSQTYSELGLSQSKLWTEGTLCITIAANIAETCFLGLKACFPDSVVGFTAYQIVNPKFVDYFIQSVKAKISAFAPATAQKNINLEILENLLIPYCSMYEQNQIVEEIESRLS
ncbi:MAG: restriction endonuclease subunit S, partial [Cyanobacteriota bacterium]